MVFARLRCAMEWSLLLTVRHGLRKDPYPDYRVGVGAPADHLGVLLLRHAHPDLHVSGRRLVRHPGHQRRARVQ